MLLVTLHSLTLACTLRLLDSLLKLTYSRVTQIQLVLDVLTLSYPLSLTDILYQLSSIPYTLSLCFQKNEHGLARWTTSAWVIGIIHCPSASIGNQERGEAEAGLGGGGPFLSR
jgi:hypothetical protein